jgi:alpha-N-arabinofuranosidase
VLRVEPRGPQYETSWLGEVPLVDAAAVLDEESAAVTLFVVNRDQQRAMPLEVDLRACPALAGGEHIALADDDPDATNSTAQPDRVTPKRLADPKVVDGRLEVSLPALSWNMIRLRTTD